MLEQRLLLSADSVLPGIIDALASGLSGDDALSDRIAEVIQMDQFGQRDADGNVVDGGVPGILFKDIVPDPANPEFKIPLFRDLLGVDVDQDADGDASDSALPSFLRESFGGVLIDSSTLFGESNPDRLRNIARLINSDLFTTANVSFDPNLEQSLAAMDLDGGGRVELMEAFDVLVTGQIIDFLEDYNHIAFPLEAQLSALFTGFLNGLDEPSVVGGFFDLDITAANTTNADRFQFDLDIDLTVKDFQQIDLGAEVDGLEINLPTEPTVLVRGSLVLDSMTLGVAKPSPVTEQDFFITPPSSLQIAVDSGVTNKVFDVHVGFLDAAGSFDLDLHMGADGSFVDPSRPELIGFDSGDVATDGTLTGSVVDEADLISPVIFTLQVGDPGLTEIAPVENITVPEGSYTLATLASAIDAAISAASAGFGGLIFVTQSGGKITFNLVSNAAPLGLPNNEYDAAPGFIQGTSAPTLGAVSFLLSRNGGTPKRVNIGATGTDLDDHVAKLQTELDAEFGGGMVTASKIDIGGGVFRIRLTSAGSLEITRTMTLTAEKLITFSELTQSDIGGSNLDSLLSVEENLAEDTLTATLDVTVDPGLDFSVPAATLNINVANPFDLDPVLNPINGNQVFLLGVDPDDLGDVTEDLQKLLDFNIIGPDEMIGLLSQTQSWLDRLTQNELLSDFDLPFVDGFLSDLLDLGDALADALLIDDLDDGLFFQGEGEDNDSARLLEVIPNPVEGSPADEMVLNVTFDTAQDLASRLGALGFSGVDAAYDPDTKELTYDIELSHSLGLDLGDGTIGFELPIDFDLELDPLGGVFTEGMIRLTVTGAIRATIGVRLGTDVVPLTNGTLLADLALPVVPDDGPLDGDDIRIDGITIAPAITGSSDVQRITGQLLGDASFGITITGGPQAGSYDVTLAASATHGNRTLSDLLDALNDALAVATPSGGGAPVDLTGSVIADVRPPDPEGPEQTVRNDSVRLKALGAVTAFEISTTLGNPTFSELGLAPGAAVTVGPDLVLDSNRDVPTFFGPHQDTTLSVTIVGGVKAGTYDVTLLTQGTRDTNYVFDLVEDLNQALASADPSGGGDAVDLSDTLRVGVNGARLVITRIDGQNGDDFSLTVASTGDPAATDLGLLALDGATTLTSSLADLLIITSAGSDASGDIVDASRVYQLSLNSVAGGTIGDLINLIDAATGGDVTANIDSELGLKLTDTTGGGGVFRVDILNDSPVAFRLGIFGQGAKEFDEINAPNVLVGDTIATRGAIDLTERFFIRQFDSDTDFLSAGVDITTPDGISATAQLGFLGVTLSGDGTLSGSVGVALADPAGEVTLAELFRALGDADGDGGITLEDLKTVVDTPDFDASGMITLEVDNESELTDLLTSVSTLGANPRIEIEVIDFGDPFALPSPQAPNVDISSIDFADFGNFDDVSFDTILEALQRASSFLDQFSAFEFLDAEIPAVGVSVNELLGVADRFTEAVEEVAANPAGTLQVLEQKLRETLGLPPDGTDPGDPQLIALQLVDLNTLDAITADTLRFDLTLRGEFDGGLPIDFDLAAAVENANIPQTLKDLLGELRLEGGAGLEASGFLESKLALGIDLLNPGELLLFDGMDATGITGHLEADADNVTFNAALGPLGVFVQGGDAELQLNVGFARPGGLDPNHTISITNPGDVATAFGNFEVDLDGMVDVTLPVFAPSESEFRGDITLDGTIALVGDALELDVEPFVPDDLFTGLDFENFGLIDNILLAIDGLDLFLTGVQDVLDGEVFGFELPVIGDSLSDGVEFVEDMRQQLIRPFRSLIEQSDERTEGIVQGFLFDLLGPSGLGLLLEPDGSGPADSADDITIDGGLNDPEGFVQWNLRLGQTFTPDVDLGFDLGFPGLSLDIDADLLFILSWDLALGLGISNKAGEGAYIDIDNPRPDNRPGSPPGAPDLTDDLVIDLTVNLVGPSNPADPALRGTLGFLQLDIRPYDYLDASGNPGTDGVFDPLASIGGSLGVDLVNTRETSDERLGFSELGAIGTEVDIVLDASVNLDITAKFNDAILPDVVKGILPSVNAKFVLDWDFDSATDDEFSISEGLNLVAFQDVGLNLGSFLGDFLGPVASKIQEVTKPLEPVVEVLTTPIPVLSDLAGRDITLVDIAELFGEVDLSFIDSIADLISFVNSIPTNVDMGLILPIGDFVLFEEGGGLGATAEDLADPNFELSGLEPPDLGDTWDTLLSRVADSPTKGSVEKVTMAGLQGESSFGFPFLENPTKSVFDLLLGKDVVLVTFDLAPLVIDFKYRQSFPIYPPLFAVLTGEAGVRIDLAFGYDTAGVRKFAEGDFSNPLDLAGGFYISDTDMPDGSFGVDVPELVLSAGIFAGAELNLGVASGGVEGGIVATINFDLYDPDRDGKVRISELVGSFLFEFKEGNPALAPLAIFEVSGDISAQLRAFIKVLFFEKTFDITPKITIVDFEIPFEREPILATERGDGTVVLNVGPNAPDRLNGNTSDFGEEIFVEQSGNEFKVWGDAFGVGAGSKQSYSGERLLVIGGDGNDILHLGGVTSAFVEVDAGAGDDVIELGDGGSLVHAGVGDDTVTGGAGIDTIFGEDGNDTIDGGGGADVIFGDGGAISEDRFIRAAVGVKDGDDEISGGDGPDVIFGGGGSDKIGGDGDWDDLDAAAADGGDVIFGDGGRLVVRGLTPQIPDLSATPTLADENNPQFPFFGFSEPTIRGALRGNGVKDIIRSHAGNDIVFGGPGSDEIDGGADNDLLFGGEGFDKIDGGGHHDRIFGGSEDDTIHGYRGTATPLTSSTNDPSDGRDHIFGEGGNDVIRGNGDRDIIHGQRGADILFGDEADDWIFGENEPDIVFGGGGGDEIEAGTGNDIVFGDDGLVVFLNSDPEFFGGTDRVIGDANPALVGAYSDDLNPRTADVYLTEIDPFMAGDDPDEKDGDDRVTGGDGDDFVFGGAADDTIFGDFDPLAPPDGPRPVGVDVLIGDGGRVELRNRRTERVATVEGGEGIDIISGNDGSDFLFGGSSGDFLYGFEDRNLPPASSSTPQMGVPDDDVIVGDNGEILLDQGVIELIRTTDVANGTGGPDVVQGNEGQDVILGGVNGPVPTDRDELDGDDDDDVLVGDNGLLDFAFMADTDLSTLDLIRSLPDGLGGDDLISGNSGGDVAIGGNGGDEIYGDAATPAAGDLGDVLLGDNGDIFLLGTVGKLTALGTAVRLIDTTDIMESTGGADTVSGSVGDDVILGGVNGPDPDGRDILNGDDDNDVILGDNGTVDFAFDGDTDLTTLDLIRSKRDELGGADTISGNAGGDAVMGGTGGDDIFGDAATTAAGDLADIILGDNGDIFLLGVAGNLFVLNDAVRLIDTTDTAETTGGADTIEGNDGDDVILGGVNGPGVEPRDLLSGNDDNDVILGDNGTLDFAFDGDTDLTTLDLIRSKRDGLGGPDTISGNAGQDVAFGGTGGDLMFGDATTRLPGDLRDILLGDNGDMFLLGGPGEITVLATTVATIRTTDELTTTGGSDTISGEAGDDIIAGGVLGDILHGYAELIPSTDDEDDQFDGADLILGDNGRLEWNYEGDAAFSEIEAGFEFLGGLSTLDLITTELPAAQPGGRDVIFGDSGNDLVFGGTDADTLWGDDGDDAGLAGNDDDVLFGDHGRLYPQQSTLEDFNSRNFFAIDRGDADGGAGDRIHGEEGDDVLLGQQGDDRMFGGDDDDDMLGGHNVADGVDGGSSIDELSAPVIEATTNPDVNDVMDGGTGDDAMAGDNATIWRTGDIKSPRFRLLTGTEMYNPFDPDDGLVDGAAAVTPDAQDDPDGAVGRDITLLDHTATLESAVAPRPWGVDIMAGGANRDLLFGQLGDEIMQGDGSIDSAADGSPGPTIELTFVDAGVPDTGETLYFNVFEAASDADDYAEGNGGADLIYGGLGQDDLIGGNSDLFGLDTPEKRPDGSDLIFGGAATPSRLERNAFVEGSDPLVAAEDRHARDSDMILGDNGRVFRLVDTDSGSAEYLAFNYDSLDPARGELTIVPRAVDLLDYSPDPDDDSIGAGDVVHGESGDDFIHGMTGDDILYGESEDDDVFGEVSNDWISGGTGEDGILGDDGYLFTSRNDGNDEPLYGIAGFGNNQLSKFIKTPGGIQQAIINVEDKLKKTANLEPFEIGSDDILYGGLGDDFMHGGAGDDAMSGAEALPESAAVLAIGEDPQGQVIRQLVTFSYVAPADPDQVPSDFLAFEAVKTDEFLLYDEFDPLRKIVLDADGKLVKNDSQPGPFHEFLLAFEAFTDADDQVGTKVHDGNDVMFGDDGNDWLVGGTNQDHLFGGYGVDMLNVDDNWETREPGDDPNAPAENDVPDVPAFAGLSTDPNQIGTDLAYDGAGRDVLIANTGADRLIGWVGEFNSYLVPFAPFGQFTVSRSLQPQLRDYLYDLSASDGADPTRADDTGSDPDRNGEPEGEMGLVLQQDDDWHDQTGAPDDPQAGNIPGGMKDVMEAEDFEDGLPIPFAVESGVWTVTDGQYQSASTPPGAPWQGYGEAASLFYVNQAMPSYVELLATVDTDKPTGGMDANAYLIFDYQSSTDYKFAGISIKLDKLQIGQRTPEGWTVLTQTPGQFFWETDYDLLVELDDHTATLIVGEDSLSYDFANPLNGGMLALGSRESVARFDDVVVQTLPSPITFEIIEDFSDGSADDFTPASGQWLVQGGGYLGDPGNEAAMTVFSLDVAPSSYLEVEASVDTEGFGGLIFDYYSHNEFKFAGLSAATGELIIGHRTSGEWFHDAVSESSIVPGIERTLELTLEGTTVTISLDGEAVLGYAFNGLLSDADLGLLSFDGAASFDDVVVRGDDPAFIVDDSGGGGPDLPEAEMPGTGVAGSHSPLAPVSPLSGGIESGNDADQTSADSTKRIDRRRTGHLASWLVDRDWRSAADLTGSGSFLRGEGLNSWGAADTDEPDGNVIDAEDGGRFVLDPDDGWLVEL